MRRRPNDADGEKCLALTGDFTGDGVPDVMLTTITTFAESQYEQRTSALPIKICSDFLRLLCITG